MGRNSPIEEIENLSTAIIRFPGVGNHFCDLVVVEILEENEQLPPVGTKLLGLMTHSGSRGTGYKIADHYTKLTENETSENGFKVDRGYGFLQLDKDVSREY